MTYLAMADAAFAEDIPPGFQIAAGYIGGPEALHIWSAEDWARFPGYRLPIWQTMNGPKNGAEDGGAAIDALHGLGVPAGCVTALAVEMSRDQTYVEHYGATLHDAGYKVWLCGALNFVFANPALNGYWVEDFTGKPHMVDHPAVRATQYAADLTPGYDASDVHRWTTREMWHG